MGLHQEIAESRHRSINEKIRQAEEGRDRGEPGAKEWLRDLKSAQGNQTKEQRQAADRDYLRRRGRDREMRSKFEKMIDALRGDL